LGLTEFEISMLCRWEGTLWARQRYERDEGIKVVDTTGMEIGLWVDRRRVQKRSRRSSPRGIKVKTHIEVEIEEVGSSSDARTQTSTPIPQSQSHSLYYPQTLARGVEHGDAISSRQVTPSISDSEDPTAAHLTHQSVMAAAAARGLPTHLADITLDPAWEQYLKEQAERGELALSSAELSAHIRAAALNAAMQNGGPTSSASTAAAAPPDSMQQAPTPSTAA
jgi:hypothetical protein